MDGIVDFKVEEVGGERRTFMGVRSMTNVAFDSRWHLLGLNENLEVAFEK